MTWPTGWRRGCPTCDGYARALELAFGVMSPEQRAESRRLRSREGTATTAVHCRDCKVPLSEMVSLIQPHIALCGVCFALYERVVEAARTVRAELGDPGATVAEERLWDALDALD